MVVEDSPEDFEVLERAFRKAEFEIPLYRCKDGKEALDLLYKEESFRNYPNHMEPPLILLDLNMPGMDGHTLLETVKDDDELKYIPIVVLSTSGSIDDIHRSYQSGANSYIQKPGNMQGYVDMVKHIKSYWFDCSSLPA